MTGLGRSAPSDHALRADYGPLVTDSFRFV
jgi:hypothetical protein